MAHESQILAPAVHAERTDSSRWMRCVIVLASTITVALSTAGPTFASDGDEGESIASAVLSTVASATEPAPQSPTAAAPSAADEGPTTTSEEVAVLVDEAAQILTAVEADPGNVNASVRVFSPGVDEPVTQENAAATPISPEQGSDITTGPDTADEAPPTSSPSTVNTNVTVRVLSPGTNGEVTQTNETADAAPIDASAAVESPNDDPPEIKPSAAGGDATSDVELDPTTQATPGDSELAPAVLDSNADGYQDKDSQYQSEANASRAPWYWTWTFAIDCAGNTTTSSSETGSPNSLDWTWEWTWDWSCSDEETELSTSDTSSSGSSASELGTPSPSTSSSGNTNVSIRVLSPGDNGPVDQTTTSSAASSGPETSGTTTANEPWSWSWTFTFCDTTTELVTRTASGTPLSWTWEWTWNWSCDAAVGAPPDLSDTAQPGTVADPPLAESNVISAPAEAAPGSPWDSSATFTRAPDVSWLPGLSALSALPSLAGLGVPAVEVAIDVGVAIVVQPELPGILVPDDPPPSPALPGVDVSVVVIGASSRPSPAVGSALATPSGPVGRQLVGVAPAAPGAPSSTVAPRPTTSTTTAWQPPAGRESRAASKPPVKRPSARPAPPDRPRGPFSPFGYLGTSQGAGAGASEGLVPGAPVIAVAALTALFVLVAPGLGRRIRVARELSPRGTYRSSIDHPG